MDKMNTFFPPVPPPPIHPADRTAHHLQTVGPIRHQNDAGSPREDGRPPLEVAAELPFRFPAPCSRKQLAQSAPDLKNGFRHTQISDDGQTIHQTLIDPDDLNDWSLHLTLDLEKSNDARTRPPPRIYRPDLRTHDLTFVVPRHRQNFALEPRQHSTYLPPNFDEAKRLPQQDRDSPLDEVIKDFARRLRPSGPDGEIHG